MAKPKSKYSGVLDKLMVPPILTGGALGNSVPGRQEEADRKDIVQFCERIAALYRHYKIEPDSPSADFALVCGLARDHVRGFQYRDPKKRGRGRAVEWTPFKYLELYADVKTYIRRNPRQSASAACRFLVKSPDYSVRYGGKNHQSLLRRYVGALSAVESKEGILRDLIRMSPPEDEHGLDWAIAAFAMLELRGKSRA